MIDSRIELGPGAEERIMPRDAAVRRRLFEGGSGVVPSSFHRSPLESARELASEASSVREQAGTLSSRAVQEGLEEEPIEEVDEADEDDIPSRSVSMSGSQSLGGSVVGSFDQYKDDVRDLPRDLSRETPLLGSPQPDDDDLWPVVSPVPTLHRRDAREPALPPPSAISVSRLVGYLPAVAVGSLLNILDGLSYGMILLPLSHAAFANTESLGLSLFYISTIISQLVFSLGGSGFKACIGSEMIEIVPFFHALAFTIAARLEGAPQQEILATTVAAFAVSCVVTGLTFFLLGWLKLGALVGFFPMHILLGCIGGVGWFLVATGVEVSARLEDGLHYNFATLAYLFGSWETVAKWGACLGLGVLLMVAERRLHHPLVVPSVLVATFALFHVVVAVTPGLSLALAREHGWVFPAPPDGAASQPWWYVYTLYRPSLIHVTPILECFPVMLALTFFGLIHVPINIPALAAATKEDSINVNHELVGHGLSNTLSGLCGSIQNYLVYTNSVMFVKSGADSPIAGIMLAVATTGIMVAGPGIIGYIPVVVVASLIFMMGFDLVGEALVDTYGSVRRQDYATIVAITLTMGCYDFVAGIVVGLVLACLFFVISSARRSPVASTMSGAHAHSTVLRHPRLQAYLDKAGQQVYVMRLAGALFFGTNGRLEKEVRDLADAGSAGATSGSLNSIRFLVIDLEHVNDIDFCTVDTFLKIKRLTDEFNVRLVLSGAETAGHKLRGLRAVDLVPETVDHSNPLSVRVFATLNIALGWCENQFIREYYEQHDRFRKPARHVGRGQRGASTFSSPLARPEWAGPELSGSPAAALGPQLGTTPRSTFLKTEARVAAREDLRTLHRLHRHAQPLVLVMQVFEGASARGVDFWAALVPFLTPHSLAGGDALPAGCHFVEAGVFHVQFDSGYYETAVAGTVLGEPAPHMRRAASIWAESTARIWTLAPLAEIRRAPDGGELALEVLSATLVKLSDRYQRMTEYYRIAD